MSNKITVWKNRTNIITVSLGMDVSTDTITSQIRTEDGVLICTWTVTFDSDGTDGELILTLDNSAVASILYTSGKMDLKRIHATEPYAVFDKPIEVEFVDSVTP